MTESSFDNPLPAPAPQRVGHYLIQKELGSGGMGTVYLGQHLETEQLAAVKILPASLSREPGFVARFGREIAAMQELQSTNIVELYESGEDNGLYYYAMEYVDGETLTARLKREKRLPWREAIDIGVQVCKALKAAHNSGIIHRDLKPSNLMLDKSDQVKLTDFGIAQIFATSKLTVTGGILGTAEYMSPEQAQGSRATRQSDLYSLGAVLYVMLTGRPPFTGKTTLDIIQKHRFSRFDSPKRIVPEIPHWLDEIVCKCLSKKPEDRYPDAYVLMLRLQEVPRKVDLIASENHHAHPMDVNAETIAATGAVANSPVGGTIVRELFRAEMEAQRQPTALGKVLDNIWVLAGLLLCLVVGVVLLFQWNHLSPEQKFAQGQQLMQQPEGPQWEVARTQYFDPLLELDEAEWRPRIEPYLAQLQLYDLKRQYLGRLQKKTPFPQSEPESFLRQAVELRTLGRVGEARKKLAALETLAAGTADWKPYAEIASQLREDLERQPPQLRLKFAQDAMHRAEALQRRGEHAAAIAIWRSVLELYDADPDAAGLIHQARTHLKQSNSTKQDFPQTETSFLQEGEVHPSLSSQ